METAIHTPGDYLRPTPFAAIFGNDHPVHVDVGAGKGRFLLARAARFPEVNFLGIERQLARIRKMNRKILRRKLSNTRLLRLDATYACLYLLPPESASTVYVLFPDPWPKKRHAGHRIMSPDFVQAIWGALKHDGVLHFATDHMPYFCDVLEQMEGMDGWLRTTPLKPGPDEQTDFERLFMNQKPIGRMSWKRKILSAGSQ